MIHNHPLGPCPDNCPTRVDVLDLMMRYESGETSDEETLTLFSNLIRNGRAWTLQGFYGRAAAQLIEAGFIDRDGTILRAVES